MKIFSVSATQGSSQSKIKSNTSKQVSSPLSFKALVNKDEFLYDFTKKTNWKKDKVLMFSKVADIIEDFLKDPSFDVFDVNFKRVKMSTFSRPFAKDYVECVAKNKEGIELYANINWNEPLEKVVESAKKKFTDIRAIFDEVENVPGAREVLLAERQKLQDEELEAFLKKYDSGRDPWDYAFYDPFPM